ncbi:hypothetical protein CPB86DRAFT_789030 [Serendipita vermifera]|nr:hypothetical protein CPB86DRAFT_789030 [Serendipita vermifera]
MSSSLVINALEDQINNSIIDLSTPFGLERIKIEYTYLKPSQSHEQTITPRCNHFCYVVSGAGSLLSSYEIKDPVLLKVDDCFSFPSHVVEVRYVVRASSEESMGLLTFTGVPNPDAIALETPLPSIPTIVDSHTTGEWYRSGISHNKHGTLTTSTDMGLLTPFTPLKKLPWNVNIKHHPPGTQSSNAHCHLAEDEFVFILSGEARYWHQGEVPEKIVKRGDSIGWKAGTGICHSLLNDADSPDGEGEDLIYLIWGDNCREKDKTHYATTNPPWWKDDIRWFDRPNLPQGPALSTPRNPRPEDQTDEAYPWRKK